MDALNLSILRRRQLPARTDSVDEGLSPEVVPWRELKHSIRARPSRHAAALSCHQSVATHINGFARLRCITLSQDVEAGHSATLSIRDRKGVD
ncbi:hypothetical protein NM688_g7902 [Phlebia brevispora]|uniref:Uncharacterized protein n=1 Tax=Phlebia brevispora TaxID=194682 RepID=A0ACC1RZW4_9APHY|nr:hypothetical protein NM688_g7902 [Phlebia brevispora]